MSELITFRSAHRFFIDLMEAETEHPAYASPPPDRTLDTAPFYVVRRVGGTRINHVVDNPTIILESWAGDLSAAEDLAEEGRAAIHAAAGTVVDGTQIYTVDEISGPGHLPDPDTDHPRVTQTFSVSLRGDT